MKKQGPPPWGMKKVGSRVVVSGMVHLLDAVNIGVY
jgi:hypothetical protein